MAAGHLQIQAEYSFRIQYSEHVQALARAMQLKLAVNKAFGWHVCPNKSRVSIISTTQT